MQPRREPSLLRQLGALFRLSAQIVAGFDPEEASVQPARRHRVARLQHSFFEAAVRDSPAAMVMLDLHQSVVACNPAFEALFGYAQTELVGRDLDTLITPEATRAEAAALTQQAGESLVQVVTQRRRKDGTFLDVELFGIPVSVAGEPVGVVGIYEDITARKRTEAWLRLANRALEAAANAIVICDHDGRIEWVNPAFTRLTGYTPEEALGQTLRLLKSGQHDQAFYRNLWGTIQTGQVWQAETINRRKDGSLYVEEQTIAPVRDERGEISHFISIKQDVTARKRAEEELQKAKEAAESAPRTKSAL